LFESEKNMLRRFGGGQRHNIVGLLSTITCKESHTSKKFNFLFPWAEGDLFTYWEKKGKPKIDHSSRIWLATQCYELVDAVAFIHDPKQLNSQNEPLFGKHGDIKPDNILWFRRDEKDVLVISDLGLASVHREQTRSKMSGWRTVVTPNYKAPECDMDGKEGYVSRSFDIWTLGCTFLEFIVWTLNGCEGLESFKYKRVSTHLAEKQPTDTFFKIMPLKSKAEEYVFQIKDQITEVSE
jgi:serine/threonine protein kinase